MFCNIKSWIHKKNPPHWVVQWVTLDYKVTIIGIKLTEKQEIQSEGWKDLI